MRSYTHSHSSNNDCRITDNTGYATAMSAAILATPGYTSGDYSRASDHYSYASYNESNAGNS